MIDDDRKARLLSIKLGALVTQHLGAEVALRPVPFGAGAGVICGEQGWVLVDERPARMLGAVVAWALQHGVTDVQLLAESGTSTLARRVGDVAIDITVWHVDGRYLLPAVAEPLPEPVAVPGEHLALGADIVAGGADAVIEHGVLSGEVGGLEVCRVVTDAGSGVVRLEVGIGAHDREAFQLLHGDRPTVEALADVVAAVAPHRLPGAAGHPLNRIGVERALRSRLVGEPQLIGASAVVITEPPLPRANLKDPVPCVATATIDGEAVTVVCSSGVDLDLIPYATDARRGNGRRCLIVVRVGDDLPVQHRLARALHTPIDIVALT